MHFEEFGNNEGKILMLLPGTCCNYETNFGLVIESLAKKYHLICVNYDGFDGTDSIFTNMIDITEKIENYILENHDGRIDGALGSSLGGSFVGQLIQRKRIHVDHGIFGSSDLDQSGVFFAKIQTKIMYPILAGAANNNKKKEKMRKIMTKGFCMTEEVADQFMECFASFDPKSILNEYYSDLITYLEKDIYVEHTIAHFIYANKMGRRYEKRYRKYFQNPDIHEFNMQHEQWLFNKEWSAPVLEMIDDCMKKSV